MVQGVCAVHYPVLRTTALAPRCFACRTRSALDSNGLTIKARMESTLEERFDERSEVLDLDLVSQPLADAGEVAEVGDRIEL